MSVNGIASLIYAVDDLDLCTRYFEDFGLPLESRDAGGSVFRLEEGSTVVLRRLDDATIPAPWYEGNGVREIIFGAISQAALDAMHTEVARDRKVTVDAEGTLHFIAPGGLPMGLKVYDRKTVMNAPDPVNAAGNVSRLNQQRKWFIRARPKTLNHIGVFSPDFVGCFDFLVQRLGFKYTDHARGSALMCRGGSTNEHHNIFIANTPKFAGFHHTAFGVEDIDEIMAGANTMERRGWTGKGGIVGRLGRHRIASALYWYQIAPVGGEAEYSADTDYLDDRWIPRVWDPMFGAATWAVNLTDRMRVEPDWMDGCKPDPYGASIEPYRLNNDAVEIYSRQGEPAE